MATKITQEQKQYKLIEQIIDNCRADGDSDKASVMSNGLLFNAVKALLHEVDSYTGTKLTEQHLLSMLQDCDGYFKDEFTNEEMDRMRYNISSDFPIFLETCVGNLQQKVSDLSNECISHLHAVTTRDTRIEDCEKEIRELKSRLAVIRHNLVCVELSSDSLIASSLLQFSSTEIIMEKLSQGIALDEKELKIVRSHITNY